MPAATPATPSVENFGFMQKYPHLSAKLGMSMAEGAGLDTSDPGNLARALSSKAAKSRLANFERSSDDDAAIRTLFKMPEGSDLGGDVKTTTGAEQRAIAEGSRAKAALYDETRQATEQYSRLANFNKEAEVQKRMRELKPTEDIDMQITSVMTQAIREKARLRSELADIDPAKRNAALTARMSVFTEEIANLSQLRASRVEAAKAKIGEEIDAKEGTIMAAKLRVESLAREMDFLKEIGADRIQYAEVARKYAEEQAKLAKARAGGGVTGEELIENAMIEEFQRRNNRMPNGEEMKDISRRAKIIKNTRPDILATVEQTGGSPYVPETRSAITGVYSAAGSRVPDRSLFEGVTLPLDARESAEANKAANEARIKAAEAKRLNR